ncbi:sec1-family transport protein, partial [Thalassiosira pseudonana CCMP1335]
PTTTANSSSSPWKLLIYDTHCRSIISPLLSVSRLRSLGVTLHLLLPSDREPIPDVPAVYFVQPTRENLAIVARDCSRNLYQCAHLHFSSRIERPIMEDFARLVVNTGGLQQVASVHDQFVDFCCHEENLFTLNVKESYVVYNNPGAGESEMEGAMERIAGGLFSVVVTLGCVPVIRCPRGGAPEMVARKLNKLITQHPTLLRSKGHQTSHHRPVLVIMDRNMDLITPIQHASTYQALIDDVLDHHANRVEFNVKPEGGEDANNRRRGRAPPPVRKKLDIDPDTDPFYSRHKFNPFPEAIESNGTELQDVTRREQQIRSKTSGSEDAAAAAAAAGGSSDLATAVESLPILLERKKKLEVHTSILQAVMNEVAARDVPQFYELEASLATGTYKNDSSKAKKDVMELVTDPTKGNVDDKVRLVIVYVLSAAGKSADIDEVAQAMKESLEMKGSTVNGGAAITEGSNATLGAGSAGSDMLSSFMARATNQATGLLAKATDRLGTMLGKIHKHRATLVVENICEMRPNTEDDDYLYLDPRVKGDVDVMSLRNATRAPVREAIAFMIGGGCYGEYQNLQMVANERRNVTYGSTEIVDPSTFLSHLGKLV